MLPLDLSLGINSPHSLVSSHSTRPAGLVPWTKRAERDRGTSGKRYERNQRTPILKIIEKYWKSLKYWGFFGLIIISISCLLSLCLSLPHHSPPHLTQLRRSGSAGEMGWWVVWKGSDKGKRLMPVLGSLTSHLTSVPSTPPSVPFPSLTWGEGREPSVRRERRETGADTTHIIRPSHPHPAPHLIPYLTTLTSSSSSRLIPFRLRCRGNRGEG